MTNARYLRNMGHAVLTYSKFCKKQIFRDYSVSSIYKHT